MEALRFLLLTLLLSIALIGEIYCQDSIVNQSIKILDNKLDKLNYELNENKQTIQFLVNKSITHYDSVNSLNQENQKIIIEAIKKKSEIQESQINELKQQLAQSFTNQTNIINWQLIIIAIAIVMIALLIVLTIQSRKNTIHYLITETRKITDGQDELLEKSSTLEQLSKEISEELLIQKQAFKEQKKYIKSSQKSIFEKMGLKKKKKKVKK
jgi:hypothetical protein